MGASDDESSWFQKQEQMDRPFGDGFDVYCWDAIVGRWEDIGQKTFWRLRWRGEYQSGDFFFVVVISDDNGIVYNVIPHHYLFDENGKIVEVWDSYFSSDEMAEYNALMTAKKNDGALRLNELRAKALPFYIPALDAIEALIAFLPNRPVNCDLVQWMFVSPSTSVAQ